MERTKRTPAGDALTRLVPDLSRVNSLSADGRGSFGGQARVITSARWQILGAIVAAERFLGQPAVPDWTDRASRE